VDSIGPPSCAVSIGGKHWGIFRFLQKNLKKTLKKVLTNEKGCDIIFELSAEEAEGGT